MSNRCRSYCIGLFAVGLLWLGLSAFQTKPGLAEPVIVPPGCPAAVAGYPYFIPYIGSSDPEMIFPTAEGYQGGATDTCYLSGFLKTKSSDKPRFGYMTIFARNRDIFDRLSADLHVFALFDLEAPSYSGTTSHFDLPPDYQTNDQMLTVTSGSLGISYRFGDTVSSVFARSAAGQLCPFAYTLSLRGTDDAGHRMELSLDAVGTRVPQAVGGPVHKGVITVFGQPDTHSYYQPIAGTGHLKWGDLDVDVVGTDGWLDRQWFPEYVGDYNGPLSDHYGHQWVSISLDNGLKLGLWRHFDRYAGNAETEFTGLTLTWPDGRTTFGDRSKFDITVTSYVRDPDLPELAPLLGPLQMLAGRRSNIRYFFDEFRLEVRDRAGKPWLNLQSVPLVAQPFHRMPVDYVHGPIRVRGDINGEAVVGLGFHERTQPLQWADELIIVLHDSLQYLQPERAAISAEEIAALAALAARVEMLIAEKKLLQARVLLNWQLKPALAPIAEPYRSHLEQLVDDVVHQLTWLPLQTASAR